MEATPKRHITVITPPSAWTLRHVRELCDNKELFHTFALREIRLRYKQTLLGCSWAVLQPLAGMILFTIIFGRVEGISHSGVPYPLFVCCGMLPWLFFSSSVSSSSQRLIDNAHLIRKVYFPRIIIPLSTLGFALLDLLISLIILVPLMCYYGMLPSLSSLFLPAVILCLALVTGGVGTFLSALTAKYRDFRHAVPFLMQLWFFATPVVYPLSIIPERYATLLSLNPLTGLTSTFRNLITGTPIDMRALAVSAVLSILIFLAGISFFFKADPDIVDII